MADQPVQLHSLARAVNERFVALKVPVTCLAVGQQTTVSSYKSQIVFDHDGTDAFGPPRATGGNPRRMFTRSVQAVARIYAKASDSGATTGDHRALAEAFLDQLLVALDYVFRDTWKSHWQPIGGAFVPLEDPAPSNRFSGALYELRFAYERPVFAAHGWSAAEAPEVTFGEGGISITSTTKVRMAGTDDDPVETGCGG